MKSTDMIYPTPISAPLAYNGTRNTIPATATGTNNASVEEGFPDITMISPADGGLPPFGQDMNGMLYMASDIKSYLQSGGFITFDQDECNAIGGYPEGAILGYVDESNIYHQVKSLIDDNTYNFVENPSYIDNIHWEYLQTQSIAWGSITGSLSNQTDLQNALNTLQPIDTALNYNDITNCIVSAPNNIKLELNDGIFTLKSGSKVYVPNGVGVFDEVTIQSDKSWGQTTYASGNIMLFYRSKYNDLFALNDYACYSGSSSPTATTNMIWYDTTNGKIKWTDNKGSTWNDEGLSLPLNNSPYSNGKGFTLIGRVFNAFGGLGSTYFLLPGVKFLFANGYNDDGSVNNIEWVSDRVYTATRTWTSSLLQYLFVMYNQGSKLWFYNNYFVQEEEPSIKSYTIWYKPSVRKSYYWGGQSDPQGWREYSSIIINRDLEVKKEISNFNFRTPFVAFDENDFNPRFDNRMQVVNTLPASPEKDIFYFCTNA